MVAFFCPPKSPNLVFLASASCVALYSFLWNLHLPKLWLLSCTEDKVTPTLRATSFDFSRVYLPVFLVHFPLNGQGETPAQPLAHRKT